jgi:predicted flap endonuclease-1-like 5' DNA nuclease
MKNSLVILFALLLFSAPALASHYPLDETGLFNAEELKALSKAGYNDTEALGKALLDSKARKAVATATSLSEKRLTELAEVCDLLRIRGVGPKMASLLRLSGVFDSSDLAKAKAVPLNEAMKKANAVHGTSEVVPEPEVLEGWINDARSNPSKLK